MNLSLSEKRDIQNAIEELYASRDSSNTMRFLHDVNALANNLDVSLYVDSGRVNVKDAISDIHEHMNEYDSRVLKQVLEQSKKFNNLDAITLSYLDDFKGVSE